MQATSVRFAPSVGVAPATSTLQYGHQRPGYFYPYGTPQDLRAGGLGLIDETDAWLTGRPYGLPGTVGIRIGDDGRSTLIGAELGAVGLGQATDAFRNEAIRAVMADPRGLGTYGVRRGGGRLSLLYFPVANDALAWWQQVDASGLDYYAVIARTNVGPDLLTEATGRAVGFGGLGGESCPQGRLYQGVTSDVFSAIVSALQARGATLTPITGIRPSRSRTFAINTNVSGVRLSGTWDPDNATIFVIVSDTGTSALATCDRVFDRIDEMLRNVGAVPAGGSLGDAGDASVSEVLRQMIDVERGSQKALKRIGFWTAVMGTITVGAAVIAIGTRVARHVEVRRRHSRTGRIAQEA